MAWGDTYISRGGITSGATVYKCPYCKQDKWRHWIDFLMDHLRFCERDYRNG